ncbi:hypothetical protein ACOQLH_35260, partial [Klebsiella pneumoniae]
FPCLAFFSAYNGINAVVFIVVTGFSLLLTLMVMNIDLSRYQLATLTSVIESVRNHERGTGAQFTCAPVRGCRLRWR